MKWVCYLRFCELFTPFFFFFWLLLLLWFELELEMSSDACSCFVWQWHHHHQSIGKSPTRPSTDCSSHHQNNYQIHHERVETNCFYASIAPKWRGHMTLNWGLVDMFRFDQIEEEQEVDKNVNFEDRPGWWFLGKFYLSTSLLTTPILWTPTYYKFSINCTFVIIIIFFY